jgi:hypothetical protein
LLDEVERLYGPQDASPDAMGRKVKRMADKLLQTGGITYEYKREGKDRRRKHVFTRDII